MIPPAIGIALIFWISIVLLLAYWKRSWIDVLFLGLVVVSAIFLVERFSSLAGLTLSIGLHFGLGLLMTLRYIQEKRKD